ncbi:MAG TPA: YgiT-type zinc finger protein [Thermoanaerobaculia bacterium]|jgi:YgiT-type zinc finger domain-containing protein
MKCHTPNCTGEHEAREISHSVVYRERTFTIHRVPAAVCPHCGDAVLTEETTIVLADLLRRKARARGTAFAYGG